MAKRNGDFGRGMSKAKREEFERKLADDFIEAIKEGKVGAFGETAWTKLGGNAMPHNPQGRTYRGINTVILWISGFEYTSNTWGTYNAWKEVSRKHAIREKQFTVETNKDGSTWKKTTEYYGVKKGEGGTTVVLWKPSAYRTEDKETGEEEIRQSVLMRYFTVFNRDQTGLPPEQTDVELEDAEDFTDTEAELEFCLEYFIDNPFRSAKKIGDLLPDGHKAEEPCWVMKEGTPILLKHGGDRAFYTSSADRIALPLREQFDSNGAYLSVKGHEIIHSTGHPLRLNRKLGNTFGSEDYAKEELIAEFGTAMLLGSFGIQGELRNVEYINNWATVLAKEPRFLMTAAQRAQKAVNYVLEPWVDHVIERDEDFDRMGESLKGKTIEIDEMAHERVRVAMLEEEE